MSVLGLSETGGIADALMRTQRNATRVAFNLQFDQIQTTAIKRLNLEVQDVLTDRKGDQKRAQVDSDLADKRKLHTRTIDYLKTQETNIIRLQEVQGQISEVLLGFSLSEDPENISADEAETFNGKRGALVLEMEKLIEQDLPDIFDGDIIKQIHQIAAELKTKQAEVGPLEDESVDPPSNQNGEIDRLLDRASELVVSALRITEVTKASAVNMLDNATHGIRVLQAEQAQYNQLEAVHRKEKIDAIKSRYANLLRSIELSFEVQAQMSDQIADNLNSNRRPPPGSVMNLFT